MRSIHKRLLAKAKFFLLSSLILNLSVTVLAGESKERMLKFDRVLDLGKEIGPAFIQDSKGFLWIGTHDGLVRYDGYDVKIYEPGPNGPSDPVVYGIEQDAADPAVLWLCTYGGLDRFDTRTENFRAYRFDPEEPAGLPDNSVFIAVQDRRDANILWIATGKGLSRFDKAGQKFVNYVTDPEDPFSISGNDVFPLLDDPHDPSTLWVGIWGNGLNKLDKTTGKFTHYRHDPKDPNSLSDPRDVITTIAQDRDDPNILWIGNYNTGMDKFDKTTGKATRFLHDPDDPLSLRNGGVFHIYDDGRGNLWISGESRCSEGLTRLDKASGKFTNYKHDPNNPSSISNNQVVFVYEDRAGILWVANLSGLIDKYDPGNQNFQRYYRANDDSGLHNADIWTLAKGRDDELWIATSDDINRLDLRTNKFERYEGQIAVLEDSKGRVWHGSGGMLKRLDPATGKTLGACQSKGSVIFKVEEDSDNDDILWVAAEDGCLMRFDIKTETFGYMGEKEGFLFLYTMFQDPGTDIIWGGSRYNDGLLKFDKTQQKLLKIYKNNPGDANSLGSDSVLSIYRDTRGRLWLGTGKGGLNRFDDETETFVRYDRAFGLPSKITAIVEDDRRHLWLGTPNSLIEFDPETERILNRYDRHDGLQEGSFRAGIRMDDGRLWFGGVKGLNSFYPSRLTKNTPGPRVSFTSLTQGGQNLAIDSSPQYTNELRLDARNNFFEFEYVALNYTNPLKNRYRYPL